MDSKSIVDKHIGLLLLFIVAAYVFSMGVRMYWPLYFGDTASMIYHGQLMINTNDGYFFSTGARDIIDGVTAADHQRASAYHVSPGLVLLTVYLTKLTPFSLDTVSLYLPAIVSSLVVIPIVLTGRMLGNTLLGFLAALIGSIAWSYYNRTMVGYYDTDMFSVLLQFTIFYAFMKIIYEKTFFSVAFATFWVLIYPLFYSQGLLITYAMFILLTIYMFLEYQGILKNKETTGFKENALSFFATVILISLALMISLPIELRAILILLILPILWRVSLPKEKLFIVASLFFIGFLYFGNIFNVIWAKVFSYADRGLDTGALQFYQVIQTVREAGAIPFATMANRISGSQVGLLLSLAGYVVLVMRHKQFIVALPLIGVGVFSLIGGLRFTVYAVPVAAISVVYLFFVIGEFFNDKKLQYGLVILATFSLLYPNITHVTGYKVPTVLNLSEVKDLEKLDKMASSKDYTITWWDYGYPIWYYSNTNTLIDGGKHTKDNFIVSKILQTSSPDLAANLSRLAVETYVDTNYTIVANTIFNNTKKEKIDPNMLLLSLENDTYPLPQKTRDIYLYLPFRMLNIFPTVMVFGNLDLHTGKALRRVHFYPTNAVSNKNGIIAFNNGIVFNAKKGEVLMRGKQEKVQSFIVTQNVNNGKIIVQSQRYHRDGRYVVVYMKSYGKFIVMDTETFKSTYIQMFVLGKYDKNLFELVISSPYSRIYKLKR